MTAEEAFAAESFDIHRNPVADLYGSNLGPHLFYNADHLVPDGDSRYGARYAAVLDMQVAGANAAECYAHDGVAWIQQFGLGFLQRFEFSRSEVGICLHSENDSCNKFRDFRGNIRTMLSRKT